MGWGQTQTNIKAVKESSLPESEEVVTSFLSMMGYLSKFIPRYFSITAPLRIPTNDGEAEAARSDNSIPFNSKEFEQLAKNVEFHHRRVMPEHECGNGEAERFMKLPNKTFPGTRQQYCHPRNVAWPSFESTPCYRINSHACKQRSKD